MAELLWRQPDPRIRPEQASSVCQRLPSLISRTKIGAWESWTKVGTVRVRQRAKAAAVTSVDDGAPDRRSPFRFPLFCAWIRVFLHSWWIHRQTGTYLGREVLGGIFLAAGIEREIIYPPPVRRCISGLRKDGVIKGVRSAQAIKLFPPSLRACCCEAT